ncbi:MAG: hypothetical protein ACRC1Z_06465 [Waterburya sp.]
MSVTVAVITVVVLLTLKSNAARLEELAAVSQQLELSFFPKGNDSLSSLWSHLDFFNHGRFRTVTNLLHGQVIHKGEPVTVAIFDYRYSMGKGDHSTCFTQTVLLFYYPTLNLPSFFLRKEQLHHKLCDWVGNVDLNFPDFPNFSNRYRLFGEDMESIQALFQPNVLKFYEREQLCTDGTGPYLMLFPFDTNMSNGKHNVHVSKDRTFTDSRHLSAQEIKPYLDKGLRLLNLFEHNA